jgi:hypothetical protein
MNDWTAGYVAEIDYTYGYYPELNPLRSQLAMLYAGLEPPTKGTHCELGFGQGLSVNIHASASGHPWYGCDFNPAQARFAFSLAQASGAPAHLSDEAFAEFCTRTDLPSFDSIGLHGIWSWINDDNRAVIVDFLRRKLKVGGALYVSYNTQPGWAGMGPMRDLLAEHAQVMGVPGQGIGKRIQGALDFADQLLAVNPGYAKVHPQVAERIQAIKAHNRHYVAHEYFNGNWVPMSFSDMARALGSAKLDYACSANFSEHIDLLHLLPEQIQFLNDIPDPMFRQSVRDILVNQSFRKDYWIKGARKLSPMDKTDALRAQRVVLVQPRADVPLQIKGHTGGVTMQGTVYNPILDALADHKVHTLGQLEHTLKGQGISFGQMAQAVMILVGNGSLEPAQDEAAIAKATPCTHALNASLVNKARSVEHIQCLASPVTGGGITVTRPQQLCLLAGQQGLASPVEWAQYIWQLLQVQGQRLTKDGNTLETAQENLAELTTQTEAFATRQLPLLKALKVA